MERLQLIELFDQFSVLEIHAVPNASHTELSLIKDNQLKMRIAAVPDKGKANKELISFFKKEFKLNIEILSGETSRKKRIRIQS